jgi:hypothetical protein
LTFSPDGSTLAVGCHGPHGLWDTATGTLISELWGGNEDSPHAFSSDGSRVATASFDKFGRHSDVWVNEFADKRVARTLYGVRPPFREVVFSPDESLLAALSNDWQIGIWERATGRLLAVLDAPPGIDTGNAGFAISPDNRKVAFSSHESSRMWEIETGTILRDWKLPIGLSDKLRFDGPEHLILARAEAEGGAQPYDPAISDPKEHPRYCALYDLLAQDGKAPSPLRKITDLDIATHRVWISPDGRYVLLDGLGSDVDAAGNQLEVHSTRLYSLERPDPPVVYAVRLDVKANVGHLFDPTGSTLALHYANTEHLPTDSLFDFVSLPGGVRRTAPISLHRLGTLARIWTASVEDGARLGFFTAGRDKPFLEVNGDSALVPHRFSRDGRYTVGITNGPPVVVDLHGLSEELQKLGVGW